MMGTRATRPTCAVLSECREAADPIGVALSITAGKRSAPADRNSTQLRPHRGRTSCRSRAGAGMCGSGFWWATAPRCPRVCLRRTRGNAKLDPYGVPLLGGFFPRVRLWLTRGYRWFDPYGVACLAVWLRGLGDILPHGMSAAGETRLIASHPLGAQPRPGILPSRWTVRAVRDAMNRVSTWRTSPAGRPAHNEGGRPALCARPPAGVACGLSLYACGGVISPSRSTGCCPMLRRRCGC